MSSCISCGAGMVVGDVETGEILTCPECGAELEVLSVDPLTLGLAPATKEDWGE